MKKIFLGIAIFVAVLIGALIALPFLFKDEIVAQIKKTANESLTATLDFERVSLSLFRHFPKLSVGLEDLSITGRDDFEGTRLLYCKKMDMAIDLWSAIFSDDIVIKGFYLDNPDIRVYITPDGRANYDIVKPGDEAPAASAKEPSAGVMKIERYAIRNGALLYDDRESNMRIQIKGLDHTGSGKFGSLIYDIATRTQIAALSFKYGGVSYLSNAQATWNNVLNADMSNQRFTLKENDLRINDLRLLLTGWVQLPNERDVMMDLVFTTPENTFKSFLSLIPGAYTKDFGNVSASGSLKLSGMIKGTYSENAYPAFRVDIGVNDGAFKYPSLPLGVSGINVEASVNSPDRQLDNMTVKIPRFALRIGSNPLEGYFNLSRPISNPTVDMRLNGTLNLGELAKAFPMEGVSELNGILRANLTAKASMNQIERQQYEQVQMNGVFGLQNMTYRSAGQPDVRIAALQTTLSPQRVAVEQFDARLGKSDLRASGAVDNILAWFSPQKTMKGVLTFSSAFFDANEWMSESDEPPPPAAATAASERPFDRWDFNVDGRINRLKYDTYDLSNLSMKGHFTPNKMTLDDFGVVINGAGDLSGSGQLNNVWNYLFNNETVSGTLNLRSRSFDLNPFMSDNAAAPASGQAEPAAEGVIPVPQNVDIALNASFDKVRYTDMDINNLNGQVVASRGVASLRNVRADLLGGQFSISGDYDTRDLNKPAYNVELGLVNLGFKDAYRQFSTMKAAAPIAQLIDGRFNTTLSMSGLLGKDMTPDLASLNAAGFLETINATLSNFKAANELATRLNAPYLSRLELGNTRNWFEIKDGKVSVKPFNLQVRDVAMQISGFHGIQQDMSYQILTKTPRKALGAGVNSGLNFLSAEAAKQGVSIANGDYINIRFDLSGRLSNPKVTFKVLGADGQSSIREEAQATVQNRIDQTRDSLRNRVQSEMDAARLRAETEARRVQDSLRNLADQKAREAQDKAREEAQRLQEEAQRRREELEREARRKADEAKRKLDEANPFRRKN
ncbi:MAG: AsmA-like C-terminal region-containing protein [Saprospiraceae bacterium]